MVPPSASSSLPTLRSVAPVKAPRTWPKNSDSWRDSGIAPQLTATKVLLRTRAVFPNELGDEFLAGAALPGDEDGSSGIGYLTDQVEQFQNTGVLSDETEPRQGRDDPDRPARSQRLGLVHSECPIESRTRLSPGLALMTRLRSFPPKSTQRLATKGYSEFPTDAAALRVKLLPAPSGCEVPQTGASKRRSDFLARGDAQSKALPGNWWHGLSNRRIAPADPEARHPFSRCLERKPIDYPIQFDESTKCAHRAQDLKCHRGRSGGRRRLAVGTASRGRVGTSAHHVDGSVPYLAYFHRISTR